MKVTLLDNKYNHNIRSTEMSWDDFVGLMENAPESKTKGKGAIIGGECVWEDVIFESKYDGEIPSGKNRKCINRTLVILDADFPTVDSSNLDNDLIYKAIDYFVDMDVAMAYYTTFSSTDDKPRYRICTYLDRPVSPEEYKKITKAIMYDLGEKDFDPVSANPNQIMYLPIRPLVWDDICEEYECLYGTENCEGNALNADKFLEHIKNNEDYYNQYTPCYRNKDGEIKEKPKPVSRELKEYDADIDYTEYGSVDPRSKNSIVGTFTKLYSIDDVMDLFLSDIYEPVGNRYKPIISSSTPGGIVLDDGLYYFSAHANTDNAYGSIKNSYDLVMCNLEDILTKNEIDRLTKKAMSHGVEFPELKNVMYEWALEIPEVNSMEKERKTKEK